MLCSQQRHWVLLGGAGLRGTGGTGGGWLPRAGCCVQHWERWLLGVQREHLLWAKMVLCLCGLRNLQLWSGHNGDGCPEMAAGAAGCSPG